jgi:hypothetical protein
MISRTLFFNTGRDLEDPGYSFFLKWQVYNLQQAPCNTRPKKPSIWRNGLTLYKKHSTTNWIEAIKTRGVSATGRRHPPGGNEREQLVGSLPAWIPPSQSHQGWDHLVARQRRASIADSKMASSSEVAIPLPSRHKIDEATMPPAWMSS